MSFIIPSSSPFVSIKLTEKGREKLASGSLNFSYWGIGDSELNYDREAIVDANPNDITLSATSKILRPLDKQPNLKSYITLNGSGNFQPLTNSNINVIKAIVNNEAQERGPFSVSGSVYTTLTGSTFSPYSQIFSNSNISGGTILNGFNSTSGFSIGDILLVKLMNDTASGTNRLGTAAPFVFLAGTDITNGLALPRLVSGDTGHIGTLSNPFTYGFGADYAGAGSLNGGLIPPSFAPDTPLGDAHAALIILSSLTPTYSYPPGAIDLATDITTPSGIGVFTPGVYYINGAANIGAAGITLSGSGEYVFQINGALTTTTTSVISLSGGATSDKVYFVPVGGASLGSPSTFVGNILSGPAAIVTASGVNIDGRLISESSVTLGGGTPLISVPSYTSGSTSINLTNSTPIPNLWFKIQSLTTNSVTVDRTLPNYTSFTSNSLVIVYRDGEIYNTIASGDTTAYWDSGTLSFDSNSNITCHDVPVWNMNNVWCENIAGITGLTSPSPIYEDYTKFGSYQYLGTKNPYLEYLCESTGNTINGNCNLPGNSYPDDISKSISIIHFTNNSISSLYGEFLYIDTTNNKTLRITLPDLMYHRRGFATGSGTTMGMQFVASGATKFVGTSDIEYVDLIEDPTFISSATTAITIGRVYPQLKIVVIHDDEIVAAMSLKSNRNWTLPALAASMAAPSGGTSTGVLEATKTIYLSYSLENTGTNGLTTSLPNQNYVKLTNNSSSAKDISFRISEVDFLPYMRKLEAGNYDGLGFYANKFKLIYQIINDATTRPDAGSWKTYDFTSTAITTVSGQTINPVLLENQNPTTTGFILDKIKDSVATTFDITPTFGVPNNSPSTLQFGDERFFNGNLNTFIGATIYKTVFNFNVNSSQFNTTSNPTFDKLNPTNKKISEVAIYDNTNTLVIIGKLSSPIELKTGTTILLELSLDF